MAEQKRPVRPVKIVYVCDNCGAGEMESGGTVTTMWHTTYPHTCNRCGYKKSFVDVSYPRIEYVDAVDVANDLARKTLELPANCETLAPTFDERHDANVAALAEIHDMVWGDTK